jgi:hypothetical protein
MSVAELLQAHGIRLGSTAPGHHYATCPQCSAKRSTANQTAKCLGITIEADGAYWTCNHCGWKGSTRPAKTNGRGRRDENLTTYDYPGEDGELLYQKVRNPPGKKSRFWLRRPDGRGGWIKGRGNARRVIYRLPETIEAMASGFAIVIAEGEKDCDNLWRIGIPATCSPDGASEPDKEPKWRVEYSEMLRGADIIVTGDDDDAGRAHMEATAAMSVGIAASVRVLDAKNWRVPPKGKDVSDWLAAGHGREEFDALVALAPDYDAAPNGPAPPSDRSNLLVSAWRKRELPPRDYLLEGLLCTTSRWLISGDTGIGKTLFALELGFAAAASANFLIWKGVQPVEPRRVMYLDGEMPAETIKERIEAAAAIYGDEVKLFAYNRDDLGPDALPPLNKPEGQKWLWCEIEIVKPDLIIFDSLMCLLVSPLAEEETWQPCAPLIRQISARRIAQVWLNHTGHDPTRSFGTKTKEWEFDLVSMLSKVPNDDTAVLLEFTKARLRTPQTVGLFKPQLIRRLEYGWTTEAATISGSKESVGARKRAWLQDAYRDLSDDVPLATGHNAAPVRKVSIENIRQTMIKRGHLEAEDGKLPASERKAFQRAREELIRSGLFAADADHLWSIK